MCFPQVCFCVISPRNSEFWLESIEHLQRQESNKHLPAGVSLPPKPHIPKPIHALPTLSALGFPSARSDSSPMSDFPTSSASLCLGMLPDSSEKVPVGLDESNPLALGPAALQLVHLRPASRSPRPIPRPPQNLQDDVLQTQILKFSSFSPSFTRSLSIYLFPRLTLRVLGKVKQNKTKQNPAIQRPTTDGPS